MKNKYDSKEEIIGKKVIDFDAKLVGTVTELSFNIVGREIALAVTTENGKELTVVSSDINNVGDVILLNKTIDLSTEPPTIKKVIEQSTKSNNQTSQIKLNPSLCKVCSFKNDEKAKFCIKCGTKLS